MLTTTFKKLKSAGACEDRYKHLGEALGGITAYGKDTPITLRQILEVNGLDDALWALRVVDEIKERDKIARLFACDCATRVLPSFEEAYPEDKRPRQAVEVARRYAVGAATEIEMDAARAAARDAARDAAWAAAGGAAWCAEREAQKQILIDLLGGGL